MTGTNVSGGADEIAHAERDRRGEFFLERGGERLAELAYVRSGEGRIVIEHTRVSDVLKGQGVGKKLVLAAVEWARASGIRVTVHCPFARALFERDPSLRDVLA
jgi:hypothetical protein